MNKENQGYEQKRIADQDKLRGEKREEAAKSLQSNRGA